MTTKIIFNDNVDVVVIRKAMGLGVDSFAAIMGVSKRMVDDWEKGRKSPKGAAKNLLIVARENPDMVKEVLLNTVKIER
jgi:putative transcriptional regulator